jgi:hypothetical protein
MKAQKLPTLDVLRAVFSYNPDTGELTRLSNNTVVKNTPEKGYYRVCVHNKKYAQSRICWALFYGEDPVGYEIDHIDRNPGDNRISNLRKVSRHENNQNRTMPLPTTGHKGISTKVCKGITYYTVRVNGRWIGQRKTLTDALDLLTHTTI